MSPRIIYAKAQVDPGWTVVEATNKDFTVSLFGVFGKPTEPGKFLYIIPSGFEIGGNQNLFPFDDSQFGRALATSKSTESLFPTGSRIRVWVKPDAFIRGSGGGGGGGGCLDSSADDEMGGGGGGAGFMGRRLSDEPTIGGQSGVNLCNIFNTDLYGAPGSRTSGGAGQTLIQNVGVSTTDGSNGNPATAAVWLRESIEILNEGSIWGGGGGGGGADSTSLGNRSIPGDGGAPGDDGDDATILSGFPPLRVGGALGEGVIQESGATVTWISNHPEGDPGSPNDVLGGIV